MTRGISLFQTGFGKFCWQSHVGEKSLRTIYNNVVLQQDPNHDLPPQSSYKSNRIRTTKYSILTFLPKNLFEQLHRFANVYFLFIVFLNFLPDVNAFGRWIALIPVACVLAVTGIKDGVEDYRRYKQDVKVNASICLVYDKQSKSYVTSKWHKVLVGDIVKVACNEVIPADLLLLKCSEDSSTCFIETANLDGESNLKQRTAISLEPSEFSPQIKIHIECEVPNAELYKFNGTIHPDNGKKKPVSKENLLLRGCVLRNTDYVEGIVIYAGHDTKAMLNSSGPRYKRSKLERFMNRDVLWCLVILLFLCFFSAIGSGVWLSEKWKTPESIPYIPTSVEERQKDNNQPAYEGFVRFWTFIIIYQVMIPLSLYATLEIVKSCQVYFIHQDRELFDDETNSKPVCRALNITEDLGQVQHIFSDKTGTLTENKMIFKMCSIGKMLFRERRRHASGETETETVGDIPRDASVLNTAANNYSDQSLDSHDRERINEFLILLATCNTVVVSSHSHKALPSDGSLDDSRDSIDDIDSVNNTPAATNGNGIRHSSSSNTLDVPLTTLRPVKNAFKKLGMLMRKSFVNDESSSIADGSLGHMSMLSQTTLKSRYEAESPDELALVKAVCNHGCRLLNRTNDIVSVYLPAKGQLNYKVLAVLPFDSTRKCMSVVMRSEDSDEIVLYTKGADNVIFGKIKDDKYNQNLMKQTRIYVTHFAKDGLRTLCMAKKTLTEEEFDSWYDRFTNCDIEHHDEEQLKLCNELEAGLDLLGATGIEDRLQDGVEESIIALQKADIKIWVLTGDKQETAINIGYSCGLLPKDAAVLTLNVPLADEIESVLKGHLRSVESPDQSQSIPKCVVIDGATIDHIFAKEQTKQFLQLAESCMAVLCCRATPVQKAQIVSLVKEKAGRLTLAIGDGANDVNMIRTANVGVGITGLEGRQASMAADFSIGRFRHLVRLLLVHGHWTYDRLAIMTLVNFFKNSNLIFVLFWFQIYCMFSGQAHIDQIYLIVFHLLFTSLPPIVNGILDQDLPDKLLMAHPRLYKQGPQSKLYRLYSYWIQIFDSLYQSLVIFFVSYFHYTNSDIGIWSFGTVHTIALVASQLTTMMLETKSWHWPFISSMLISIWGFWTFILVLGATCNTCDPPANPYWIAENVSSRADTWLVVVLSCIIACIPRYICRVLYTMFYPTDAMRTRSLYLSHKSRYDIHVEFPVEGGTYSRSTAISPESNGTSSGGYVNTGFSSQTLEPYSSTVA